MGVLAYNLLRTIRQFYVWGEEVRRSIDWLIKRLIKVGARISYHARRWYVHVASAFPLSHIIGRCWPEVHRFRSRKNPITEGLVCPNSGKITL